MPRLLLSRQTLSLLLLPLLAACATMTPPCQRDEQAATQDLLYFGTNKSAGQVSPEDWAGFLGMVVTPRFPDGLTVGQAAGQWRNASGAIVREASYVLNLVHPDSAANEAAIRAIVASYKTRFEQDAVLRAKTPACMSFP